MLSLIKKIANMNLAIALLVATTGVTLNKHYCMDRLMSAAINAPAIHCADEDREKQMPCCEDVSQELKINDITQVSFDFDSQPDLFQIAIIQHALLNRTLLTDKENTCFEYHPPPPANLDFQAILQVFLV